MILKEQPDENSIDPVTKPTPTVKQRITTTDWNDIDQKHIWHPYTSIPSTVPCFLVESAKGAELTVMDNIRTDDNTNNNNNNDSNQQPERQSNNTNDNNGRRYTVVDGMSSWWACIHGYNHPILNDAIKTQLDSSMAHVMFGGLTHSPAIDLTLKLLEITPAPIQHVFYCDSGSVAIEVAMKMALQYWHNTTNSTKQQQKNRFVTIRGGYHGDTFMAMSVCDPINGMHSTLFDTVLPKQYFVERPTITYDDTNQEFDETIHLREMKQVLEQHSHNIAAVILEPIVQGAGGMYFYSPQYLIGIRQLCNDYNVLLILDEIATGFGRTGKHLWGFQHTNDSTVVPDIMCIGKALTGGYMSFAATLTTSAVAEAFNPNNINNNHNKSVLMHGPTFMGNPLACAVSLASINLLQQSDWKNKVQAIETQLRTELQPCLESPNVANVRVLGAIGVVEMKDPIDMNVVQPALLRDHNVWLRPFGKLLYTMPPFTVITTQQISQITKAMVSIATRKKW